MVIHLVEETLGTRCTNICRPLNSYINRVYEVQQEDGEAIIAKFYRPNRWNRKALQDEHDFLLELQEAEIPVIAPVYGVSGESLHEADGSTFALFPKKGGRICDEPNDEQWQELGRLIARVHTIGSSRLPHARITLGPHEATRDQLDHILTSETVSAEHQDRYEELVRDTIELISSAFEDAERMRIHGDCHYQNLIYRPGESFFIIDFDDMAVGPPVQDIWMLLPGRLQDSRREINLFLEGYETFREFDYPSLKLIEPLRAMRYIHFTVWCVQQAEDGGFSRLTPDWGTSAFWRQEISELEKQQIEIQDALAT